MSLVFSAQTALNYRKRLQARTQNSTLVRMVQQLYTVSRKKWEREIVSSKFQQLQYI